ncbi:YihY/virulence factor BrkB family protein [Skermania sp. ID1734]|uniref:YihY/virulence factor BrkB family protein n=1 Tax=Skermania sp. ID1734 TaxID=2597516 RepID=UPI00117CD359|nr:YihY/virulence factor BrkB family protein [Skermania sp. ID1734]TSE01529.1 YihY/virulence factor BrkB family protein [Skermania sp. ID1734]
MIHRLDRIQQRHRSLGFVIAVIYKYLDDQGGYLAALIAYYAFLSLFPLLLLLTTVTGVVLAGHPALQADVLNSALHQFPVIGDQLGHPKRLSGGMGGVIVGVIGALYGASGVGQASQNAMDTVWAIPRNNRPDPLRSRLRSFGLIVVLGAVLLATTAITAVVAHANRFGVAATVGAAILTIAIDTGVFAIGFRVGTARELTFRQVLPGAALMALIWQILQNFGSVYVAHVVKSASNTNSVFAVVLGLLGFLYISAIAVVLCAEINVVADAKLHPRALLTPFTDNVTLTGADRRTYSGQAKAQRAKGFEDIDVDFHQPGHKVDDEPS